MKERAQRVLREVARGARVRQMAARRSAEVEAGLRGGAGSGEAGAETPARGNAASRAGTGTCEGGLGLRRVVVAVDDTDDATKATSTGEIAGLVAKEAEKLGGQVVLGVTRHQLLISDAVPYTSHNSAMAFEARMPEANVAALRERAIEIIARERAATSDPGLCIALVPDGRDEGENAQLERVMAFGYRAKAEFCPIAEAYELAESVSWLSLSEHGGTGAGVVGALAGAALRMEGNDGRFRGKWDLQLVCGCGEGRQAPVRRVVECLSSGLNGRVLVIGSHGEEIDGDVPLALEKEVKPMLKGSALAIVCERRAGVAVPCKKADLGEIGNVAGSWRRSCASFEWDNDLEECLDAAPSCKNCLYRRWLPEGFKCMLPELKHA